MRLQALLLSLCCALAACGGPDSPSVLASTTYGPNPKLPPPAQSALLPVINVADAVGWPDGAAPIAPAGFTVTRYADGFSHGRWIYVLPNGDVLVAEGSTRASNRNLAAVAKSAIQERAGAIDEAGNRIVLLRDSDADGEVDERHVFLSGLNQPFGMTLIRNHFYVANTDAVWRYRYTPGATSITTPGQRILSLPYNPENNGHWTRDLLAKPDGSKIYVSVGSVSNVPKDEAAFAVERRRANILEINPDGSGERIFASGLRNPNGLAWNPDSGQLWVAVNERDELGEDLVPDYMTSVREGGFYGWPYSYFGQHIDPRVTPQNPELVARAIVPDYALGAHTASMGVHFYTGNALPARYRHGAFIGQHGSWNRSSFSGYKVVFVPFVNGRPSGEAQDFLTGFLNARGQAQGRPVGVATDRTGAILVADDVGDIVWRVAPSPTVQAAR